MNSRLKSCPKGLKCGDVAHVNGTSCEFDAMACLLSLTIY